MSLVVLYGSHAEKGPNEAKTMFTEAAVVLLPRLASVSLLFPSSASHRWQKPAEPRGTCEVHLTCSCPARPEDNTVTNSQVILEVSDVTHGGKLHSHSQQKEQEREPWQHHTLLIF